MGYLLAMPFYAYLLRCNDGSYYAGHTDNLELRIAQHDTAALGGYTAGRLPVSLVWCDTLATRDEAFAAERKLKGWSRAKKEALIEAVKARAAAQGMTYQRFIRQTLEAALASPLAPQKRGPRPSQAGV